MTDIYDKCDCVITVPIVPDCIPFPETWRGTPYEQVILEWTLEQAVFTAP